MKAIGEDKPFLFNDGVLLHLREPEVVGFDAGGWGIPQAMFCYGTSRYLFGLRKMNEVLASDYMISIRIASPKEPTQGGQSFMEGGVTDMADFTRQFRSVVARHRKDPASIHVLGQPVEYQTLGAEGKSLVTGELLIQGEDMHLNAMGYPAQFHRGDLELNTAPMAARLIESHHQNIPSAANTFLGWVVKQVTPYLGWKEFGVKLTQPKIADNLDQLMLLLQLRQTGEVSATTLLPKVGLDRAEEQRRMGNEAVQSAKLEVQNQAELDKVVAGNDALNQTVQQQQAMMAGAPPEGGMPPVGATGVPAADPLNQIMMRIRSISPQTPIPITEIYQIAQEAAAVLVSMPELDKRQKLREIDQLNKPIGDMIRSQMKEVRGQQDSQHISQGRAAMQQGGMAM